MAEAGHSEEDTAVRAWQDSSWAATSLLEKQLEKRCLKREKRGMGGIAPSWETG